MYRVDLCRQARKDIETARRAGHSAKVAEIMVAVERNPYEQTSGHFYEKLAGNMKSVYSRRINYSNRFIYSVFPNDENELAPDGSPYEGIVRVHESWGHNYK